MRILICYPWLKLGGAPKTAITLAKGLKERGHEIYFFTKKGGMYEDLLKKASIPIIPAPYHPFLPQMFHLNHRAYRILKKTIRDYSIDIVHSFHPLPYFLSLFAVTPEDIPAIYTVVGPQDRWPYPAYPGRVIFVAKEFRDKSEKHVGRYSRERIVLPNRVDLDRFSSEVDWSDFARKKGLPEKGWKIAFMSRLDHTKEKSVYYSMEAVESLLNKGRNVILAIAGDGTHAEKLMQHADTINSKRSKQVIKFIGPIEQTPEFLSWADIVLGIGRCAFEGMATSKPTLIVGEKGLAGVVEDVKTEELQYYNFAGRNITEQQDISLLANAIEEILTNKEKYRDLAEFSREYVKKNYGYREGARKLEQIYEKSLSEMPLTGYEKTRTLITAFLNGYCRRAYKAARTELVNLIRR